MTVIVPCAGESKRFKGLKKQFLTHPIGLPLPIYSASGLRGENLEFEFVFVKHEFEDRFGSVSHFLKATDSIGMKAGVILISKQTVSQTETVLLAGSFLNLEDSESFYVKDCDNYFEANVNPNTVATINMYEASCDEVRNKSFSRGQPITEIKERAVISPKMNVGGYGFNHFHDFRVFTRGCATMSEVIANMISLNNQTFYQETATNYEDYGTLDDWMKYLKKFNENE